ncbi:MAG: MFS transporter [Acidimicrobiales bacterium]
MTDNGGWKALGKPTRPPRPDEPATTEGGSFAVSPFVRLSRVHALSAAGDAMVAVALAGSLFFSIDPATARWRVGLYLALTIAPFALVSPLIGPALDRAKGGRRAMVIAINGFRVLFCLLMINNLDSLLLFPLAFGFLVLQKGYAIAKAAIVPTTVTTHDELVLKNSRLALLSGVAGFTGAAPAALAQLIGGPGWSVALAVVAFALAFVASLKLPRVAVATAPPGEVERAELRRGGIVLAASATGMLRGIFGFFTFLVAFAYRGGTDDIDLSGTGSAIGGRIHEELLGVDLGASGTSALKLGVVVAFTVIGTLCGALSAPKLRQRIPEERLLLGALVVISATAFLGVWSGGLSGAVLVAFAMGLSVSAGKLAFDSIVQRDAPDANYGRTFARFETRFQLFWVFGAIIPTVLTIPARFGFFLIAGAAGAAAFSYYVGSRAPDDPLVVDPPVLQPVERLDPTQIKPATPAVDPTMVTSSVETGASEAESSSEVGEGDPTLF